MKFFVILSFLFCLKISAFESQTIDRIITHEKGVVILLDNAWVEVDALQVSENGVLVLENGEWLTLPELRKCDPRYSWQCTNCKAWNPSCSGTCYNCKGPKYVPKKEGN